MQPTPPRHAIRLGDAWEQPEPAGDRVRLTRRFGRPTGLEPGDRVLLVTTSATVAADVSLNGTPLPPIADGAGRWEQDVTRLLRDRNELAILVPAGLLPVCQPAAAAGAPQRVAAGTQIRGRPPAAVGTVAIEIVAGP